MHNLEMKLNDGGEPDLMLDGVRLHRRHEFVWYEVPDDYDDFRKLTRSLDLSVEDEGATPVWVCSTRVEAKGRSSCSDDMAILPGYVTVRHDADIAWCEGATHIALFPPDHIPDIPQSVTSA